MPEQLACDLAVRPSLGRGDFFVSSANALALGRLDAHPTWPIRKLVLTGPEGAGKTHLAHVWAGDVGARMLDPGALSTLDIGALDGPVVLDDADALTNAGEVPLFHLHNHLAASGWPLLLTARTAPSRWTIALPDLKSRLEAAEVARIDPPDDALLSAVLMKLFADRQVSVSPRTIAWLTTHMDRSFSEALRVVEALDRQSLSEGRKVTRELAARLLDNTPNPGP